MAAPATPSGLSDPRLRALRDVLAGCAAEALRRYGEAWAGPGLDDPSRAVAGIGLLDPTVELSGAAALVLPEEGLLAEIADATGLDVIDELVLAAAWWSTVDPQVAVVFGCVHDDATRRYPTLGALALLLAQAGLAVPLAVPPHHRLVASGLLDPVDDADTPLRLPRTTSSLLAGLRPAAVSAPTPAPRLGGVVEQAATLIRAGGRVVVRCPLQADRPAVLAGVASRLGLALGPVNRPPQVADLLWRLGHELPATAPAPGEPVPPGTVLVAAGAQAAPPAPTRGWHTLDAGVPNLAESVRCWRQALRAAGLRPGRAALADLAGRMPLAESAIDDIVIDAGTAARAADRVITLADVRVRCRDHPRHDLDGLARRFPASLRLDDLVFTDLTRTGLDDLVAHARFSAAAHDSMALAGGRGRAVTALFHGPSGTGKTAAAEAVAAEIDRDLWVVDMAKVVSKWLGETQRNLDTMLTEAAAAGAVLLFDEADGLFGRRGEVTDARDRYANLEIDHLLQRIEIHQGVVVLTTNRPAAIDEAFGRRIRLSVRFDLPSHTDRERIWRQLLPEHLLVGGASTDEAAREELSGGAIRSAALSAMVAATAEETPVSAEHLRAAVRRELDKSHRPLITRAGGR